MMTFVQSVALATTSVGTLNNGECGAQNSVKRDRQDAGLKAEETVQLLDSVGVTAI